MNEMRNRVGSLTPTSPPSTPLDTLKALALRNFDRLEYILDQMVGTYALPEEFVEYVDALKQEQLLALAEHVPVAPDELLNELRYVHPDGLVYDDGTPVVERWADQYGVMDFYPRYDGDRALRRGEYDEWVAANRAEDGVELKFLKLVKGLENE